MSDGLSYIVEALCCPVGIVVIYIITEMDLPLPMRGVCLVGVTVADVTCILLAHDVTWLMSVTVLSVENDYCDHVWHAFVELSHCIEMTLTRRNAHCTIFAIFVAISQSIKTHSCCHMQGRSSWSSSCWTNNIMFDRSIRRTKQLTWNNNKEWPFCV